MYYMIMHDVKYSTTNVYNSLFLIVLKYSFLMHPMQIVNNSLVNNPNNNKVNTAAALAPDCA